MLQAVEITADVFKLYIKVISKMLELVGL